MPSENPNPAFGADQSAYIGIPSFMRLPVSRELNDVDVAIVGVPFGSGATSWRSGSRFGPRAIRNVSPIIWGHHTKFNVTPTEILKVVDYGDIEVKQVDINTTQKIIQSEITKIIKADTKVIALGGDHSISLPLLRAYAEKYDPLAFVHFDSHSDTETGDFNHGTPFTYAIKEGLIDPKSYIQIGIRGPVYDRDIK
jgi:agmatinase/guanidinopropionase